MKTTLILFSTVMASCALASQPAAASMRLLPGPTGQVMQITTVAHARGVAIVIHGGAWQAFGPGTLDVMADKVRLVTHAKFTAINTDYRPGADGLEDVTAVYDWARRRYGPMTPICAVGDSSGGHFALMLAVRRLDLACVIAMGAITDLPALRQDAPDLFERFVVPVFPADQLDAYSPARLAAGIHARVLMAAVVDDPIVPVSQQTTFLAADPAARGVLLAPGDAMFVHRYADRANLRRFNRAVVKLLASVARFAAQR